MQSMQSILICRLQLHISKSIIMLLGSWQKLRNRSVRLFINGKALVCATSTRYFGVIMDQHLAWKLHVSYVMKRVRGKIFALNCLKPLPDHLLSKLYQAFVLPIVMSRGQFLLVHYPNPWNVYIPIFMGYICVQSF